MYTKYGVIIIISSIILIVYSISYHFTIAAQNRDTFYKFIRQLNLKYFSSGHKHDSDYIQISSASSNSKSNSTGATVNFLVKPPSNLSTSPIKVLLLTEYRSGSTFSAELFNKNPKAFYYFEPLFAISKDGNGKENQILKEKSGLYLKNLLNCNMPDLKQVYNHKKGNEHLSANCWDENFCWRSRSDRLRKFPFCGRPEEVNGGQPVPVFPERKALNTCGPVNLALAEKECSESDIVVTKTIRFPVLEYLEDQILDTSISKFGENLENYFPGYADDEVDESISNFLKNSFTFQKSNNFRIIYIIRDPRGMAASRVKIGYGWSTKTEKGLDMIKNICENLNSNINYIKKQQQLGTSFNQNNWLRNKILIIRYEDLTLNSLEVADKVYKFLNLENSKGYQSVKNWATSEVRRKKRGTWDTDRSKETALKSISKWSKILNFEVINSIQENCGPVFENLGYKKVKEEDLFDENIKTFGDCELCESL